MRSEQSKGRSVIGRAVAVVLMTALALVAISGCDEDSIERQLGRSTAASVESTYGVNHDPLLCEWITHVGQTMVSFSTRQQIPYTFKVLETDIVNAFAGPWGHVYVTEGLLEFAETEDEIWTVVGHELGHVEHRDIIKSLKQSLLFGVGASIVGGESQTLGDIAGIGAGLLSLRYSRKDEYAADDEGRWLSYAAGHDPHDQIRFFNRLQKEKERGSPSYLEVVLSTHPPTERRIDRQQQQPELNPSNVAALLHIGRGYMRRAHYGQAVNYLESAVDLAPDSVQAHTALADALAGRGEHELAAQHYQIALSHQHSDRYVAQRLNQAQNPAVISLAAVTPQETAEAQQYLDKAGLIALQASTAAVQVETFSQQLARRLAPATNRNRQTTDELLGLAGGESELDDSTNTVVIAGNAAISRAADSVYAAEQIRGLVAKMGPRVKQTGAEAHNCMERLAAGQGYSGQGVIVRRSLTELETALSELQHAREQALGSVGMIQQAQNSAADTLETVRKIMHCDEDDEDMKRLLISQARLLSAATDSQAEKALAAVKKAKKPAAKAQLRTLVSELNLVGLKADATQIPALDKLVAYYTMGQAAEVSRLREEGFGYGDTALVLAGAKSARQAPSSLAKDVSLGRSLVDQVSAVTDSSYGARVLLRFLAGAMAQEVTGDT